MNEIHGYCGYRCDMCPAFVRNQKGPEDRQKVSDGWQKYLGFRMEPEKIVCAGCPFEGCHLDSDCQVRPCAIAKGFATCAECAELDSCEKLRGKAEASIVCFSRTARLQACPGLVEGPRADGVSTNRGYANYGTALRDHWSNYLNL
jgi:hypothetical protein